MNNTSNIYWKDEILMDYRTRYDEWSTETYFDEFTKKELLTLIDNDKEIRDRFHKDLSFGTGGLRGIMGAGTNRINSYTIKKVTLGLGNYIQSQQKVNPSVVIAFDTRNYSQQYAQDVASILSSLGIQAYLFDAPMPTPVLSYAVRYLQCDAGVVITASHNPKEYNGYKVYDFNGGQLTPNDANEVISFINQINGFDWISSIESKPALIEIVGSEILDAFIREVNNQSIYQGELNVVYTPIHGAGNNPVRQALKNYNVSIVKEQELPDGNFSSVISPNPEDKKALQMAINQAMRENADIVIGTDPDCDRIGVAVNHNDQFKLLTGNQIGALLVDFVTDNREINSKSTLVKTIVTNDLGANIAISKGLKILDTLTGFKYIGEKINEFEAAPDSDNEFVMGYEESYGYLVGTHARDKDAVVAARLICEMAAYYKTLGLSLVDRLESIYGEYGYYMDVLDSVTLKGIDGATKIQNLMAETRKLDNQFFNNTQAVKDYSRGIDNLPKEDVIKFLLTDESWVAIRPSGTEPKIKIYYSIKAIDEKIAQIKLDDIKLQIRQNLDLEF